MYLKRTKDGPIMIKILFWFFVFVSGVVSIILVCKGVEKNSKEGSNFKWQELFKEKPINESSGTIIIIEGIFVLLCGAIISYIILYKL